MWDFGLETDPVDILPDIVFNNSVKGNGNGNGKNITPYATIEDDNPIDMSWVDTNRGHSGIWKTEGDIKLDIPNIDNDDDDSWKIVILQMIYDAGIDQTGSAVDAWLRYTTGKSPNSPLSAGLSPVESQDLGDGFKYSRWEFAITPSPDEETIYLLPFYSNLYVDSIEVDTLSVPEPAAAGLLGLGMFAVLIRKRTG